MVIRLRLKKIDENIYIEFLGFTNYLLSPECDVFNPKNASVYQEMDHPLNHYFIASSHNT